MGISTRTKTVIKIKESHGLSLDFEFKKDSDVSDIICGLIDYSGMRNEPEMLEKIRQALSER